MAERPPLSAFMRKQKEEEIDVKVLRGKQGDIGLSGKDGLDGKDGKQGPKGEKGDRGETGFRGERGDDGITPSLEELEAIVLSLIPDVEIPELAPKDLIEKINKAKTAKISRTRIEGMDELEGLAKSANKNVQNILSLGGSRQTIIKNNGSLTGTGITTINFTGGTVTKVGNGEEITVPLGGAGGGQVNSIVAGTGISVNSTDPANPIVSATGSGAPGGSTTQFQYNNAGAFGGTSRVTSNGSDLIFTGQSPTYTQGKLVYDTDNESLTFYNNDSNISLQIGQEQWLKVINKTGSTIANGAAVYVNGVDVTSGLQTIALAKGDAATTIIGAGLTTESIANNAIGYVTVIGVVHGLDTSGFSAGATVFISSTVAGGLVSTAPTAPNYRYRIGIVGVSSATVGTINVTPSTAALGNGTANQVFGINNAGTAQEVKSIVGTANQITITNTANTITASIPSSAALPGSPTTTTQTQADNSTKIATTAYVDAAVLGQNFKEAVRVATTGNLIGIYLNGSSGVGATFTYTATGTDNIDGVNLVLNDRVLIKNQTTDFQNGIYTVTTAGAIGVAGILTRAIDANQSSEFKAGDSVFVTAGTTLTSTTWAYTGIDSPTMGTTSLTYAQVAGQGSFTAGNGIAITGTSIAIDTSITVDKTTAQTLTNKRITNRVVVAADATSITPNSDNADITQQTNTQSVGTLTINADGGTPTNGQGWLLKIKSTNVQTFAWNGVFIGGTTALPTATTGGGKIDYYPFIYDTINSKFHYVQGNAGF